MRYQLLATMLIVFLTGCEPPQAQPGPATTSPAAAPTMGATTVWNQAQVEQFLKDELALTTIAIKSTGGDNYQGTGADAEGSAYTLIVKQVPGGIKVEWRHQSGNGTIGFGKPMP
jgi:hypothetical protein